MVNLPLLVVLGLFSVIAVACGSEQDLTAPPITANVLVEPREGDETWFTGVSVPKGTDGYELLEAAVNGELGSEWFAEYQSHFVTSVLGEAAEDSAFWGVFIWNDGASTWEPLPIGADQYSVKEGSTMGWALVEYGTDSLQVPTSTP